MHPADFVAIRKKMCLTQIELADKLGISVPTLSRMETKPGAISLRDQLALERLQEISPPRRLYLIDQIRKEIKPCTRAMADAENAIPVYNDSAVTFYMTFAGAPVTWTVPMPTIPKSQT
jgi:transcriptional regulator with XRE-family HTH domain